MVLCTMTGFGVGNGTLECLAELQRVKMPVTDWWTAQPYAFTHKLRTQTPEKRPKPHFLILHLLLREGGRGGTRQWWFCTAVWSDARVPPVSPGLYLPSLPPAPFRGRKKHIYIAYGGYAIVSLGQVRRDREKLIAGTRSKVR